MKSIPFALALAAAACAFAPAARAQSSQSQSNPITIKLGAYLPPSGGPNNLGSTWIAGGLDYALGAPQDQVQQNLYVNYTGKSDSGRNDHVLGVGIDTHSTSGPSTSSTPSSSIGHANLPIFRVVGIGAYFQTANNNNTSKTGTSLGVMAGIGISFSQAFDIEGDYTWITDKINGVNLGGISVMAGLRF
ncbi:MAG: hypothetical protein ACLQVD_05035 [Capsulimonadaceae bacterium]